MMIFWNLLFDVNDWCTSIGFELFDNFVWWLIDLEDFFLNGHLKESIDFWIYCLSNVD